MSKLSSDTLFHFTSIDNLLGILENEFYPRFHLERYYIKENIQFSLAIPMVCFCDIPLSQIDTHIEHYDHYGIGMSKEWAEKKGLNPVLYLYEGSNLSITLNAIMDNIFCEVSNLQNLGIDIESLTKTKYSLLNMFRYVKSFEDGIIVKGQLQRKKLYDEREWRYVPNPEKYDSKRYVLQEGEFQEPTLTEANEELKKAKLTFEPDDIRYIIVKKEGEREEMIKQIEKIKSKYNQDTKNILISRIITSEQIAKDF